MVAGRLREEAGAVDHGAALRRSGRRQAAREPLRRGLDLARAAGLAERAGVVAIPTSVFHDDVEAGRHLVRWAFCKQEPVITEALRRLRVLRASRR